VISFRAGGGGNARTVGHASSGQALIHGDLIVGAQANLDHGSFGLLKSQWAVDWSDGCGVPQLVQDT
jgi:hypothetical protein